MLKKTSFPSAYSGLQCCVCVHSGNSRSNSPSVLPSPRARPSTNESRKRKLSSPTQWRSYATVKDSSKGYDFRDNMNWPCRRSAPSTPSPYEIFELDRGAVYSKHKYYELVKIYHPDKHTLNNSLSTSPLHNSNDTLSPIERLERYRLVVQAHEILSDPIKRRAYDTYGAGWGPDTRSTSRHSRGFSSSADGKTYGYGPEHDSSPFANATWEDWERWYASRAPPSARQAYHGTYANPNAFASFVILLAVLSGVAQATRAGQYSGSLEEKAAAFTEETSRFLSERADHYDEQKMTSDGRIRHFLEKRDPSRYGLKDEEQEAYRKHFGGRDMLSPTQTVAEVEGRKPERVVRVSKPEIQPGDGAGAG